MSLAPDTNISSSSTEETVYIPVFGDLLPFSRDADVRSGLGVVLWGGGDYEYPLRDNLRLRAGGSVSRREYEGRDFDQTFLSAHVGPRWLVGNRTEIGLLGSARRQWVGGEPQFRSLGARFEMSRLLSRRVLVRTQASHHQRTYDKDVNLDGPRSDFSLAGLWQVTPTTRLEATVGLTQEQTTEERYRNTGQSVGLGTSIDLPRGFTVGLNGSLSWRGYEGNWGYFTPAGEPRSDRTQILSLSLYNRAFTVQGFSPKLVVTRETRESNAQAHDYQRTRAELQFVRVL